MLIVNCVGDNDNKAIDNGNGADATKNDDATGPRNEAVRFKSEETFITEKRIINPTDNEGIRRRKNKTYADAVKQHNRIFLNEMNEHLIK